MSEKMNKIKFLSDISAPNFVGYDILEALSFLHPSELHVVPRGTTELPNTYGMNSGGYWDSLKVVVLPEGLTSIGEHAFYGCPELQCVILPDSLESIGAHAFSNCPKLVSLSTIPASTSYIDATAFSGNNIAAFEVAKNNPNFDVDDDGSLVDKANSVLLKYAGGNNELGYVIPSYLSGIGDYAFSGCTKLTSIGIPDHVLSVGTGAFANCSSLEEVSVGARLNYVGAGAFNGCSRLETISFASGGIHFGQNAFYGCSPNRVKVELLEDWLTMQFDNEAANPFYGGYNTCMLMVDGDLNENFILNVPHEITRINPYAFYNCNNLNGLSIPSTLESIGTRAFANCKNLEGVEINGINNNDLESGFGEGVFENCEALSSVTIGAPTVPGLAISANMFKNCELLNYVSLDDDLGDIGNGAFYGCAMLPSTFSLPAETRIIGNEAFRYAGVGEFGLPLNLSTIGAYAFANSALQMVTIPLNVTTIGEGAFAGCTSLSRALFYPSVKVLPVSMFDGCELLSRVSLPEGLVTIDSSAFSGCRMLRRLVLPSSIKYINSFAFTNCYELNEVFYNGEMEDFNNIFIDAEAFGSAGATYGTVTVYSIDTSYRYDLSTDSVGGAGTEIHTSGIVFTIETSYGIEVYGMPGLDIKWEDFCTDYSYEGYEAPGIYVSNSRYGVSVGMRNQTGYTIMDKMFYIVANGEYCWIYD